MLSPFTLEMSRCHLHPCRRRQELKAKLAELEGDQRSRTKATIAALESKLRQLDEQLEAEAKERLLQAKANRKLEKRWAAMAPAARDGG